VRGSARRDQCLAMYRVMHVLAMRSPVKGSKIREGWGQGGCRGGIQNQSGDVNPQNDTSGTAPLSARTGTGRYTGPTAGR
jgi:hypothetical protein